MVGESERASEAWRPWMIRPEEGHAHALVSMNITARFIEGRRLATVLAICVSSLPSTLMLGFMPMGGNSVMTSVFPRRSPRVETCHRANQWEAIVCVDKLRATRGAPQLNRGPLSFYVVQLERVS